MVTDAIMKWFGDLFASLMGAFPAVPVPDWLSAMTGVAGTVFGAANSMGVWFPTGLAVTVVGTLIATWGIAFVINGARIALSLFTGGGGGL